MTKETYTIRELRGRLRHAIKDDPLLMHLMGGRISRKQRAAVNGLRRPTPDERLLALKLMLDSRWPAHKVEALFNRRGIKMTRNMLSKLLGARA